MLKITFKIGKVVQLFLTRAFLALHQPHLLVSAVHRLQLLLCLALLRQHKLLSLLYLVQTARRLSALHNQWAHLDKLHKVTSLVPNLCLGLLLLPVIL